MKRIMMTRMALAIIAGMIFNVGNSPSVQAANCDPPPAGLLSWWHAEGNATNGITGSHNFQSLLVSLFLALVSGAALSHSSFRN